MPKKKVTEKKSTQFLLRLPSDMRDWLEIAAEHNGRSINSEIVSRLKATEGDRDGLKGIRDDIDEMLERLQDLEEGK